MQNKTEKFDPQEVARLAGTDAGKQLMALLKQQYGDQMQHVMTSMKTGNMEQAKTALSAFMSDPRTGALLRQLQEEQHGRNGR